MSILGRIGELRKRHEKLSINKLEQECGLTRGSMAKWDDHAPSPDKVKKVADYFNVSVEYLLYGDPSAGIKKDPIPKDEAVSQGKQQLLDMNDGLSDEQKELLALSRKMSDDELKRFIAAMKAMLGESM